MYLSTTLKIISLITVIAILLAVSACGGEDAFNAGGCNAADTPTDIHSFAVVGVSTDAASGLEVINDSGDFTLSWDLTSSCTYTYSVYLSENSEFGAADVEFASGSCGVGYSCTDNADINCRFDSTDNTITCDGGAAVAVGDALPGSSPQTPYIFFTASNEMSDEPAPVSEQVQFEF